jgi:nitrogen PTS system EIIA component
MQINQLITPDRVKCLSGICSKKRALESLSLLLGSGVVGIDPTIIFHQLIERERLGSTGLGHGVALPHGRLSSQQDNSTDNQAIDLTITLGCFIKLDQGVDFDSPDNMPADLLFGLLVPENCTNEHLQVLATLAKMFSDTVFCDQLRHCHTDEELFAQLSGWAQTHQVAS